MNGEMNPYKKLIVNNAEKVEPLMTQMEQWYIISNVLNYIQYDRHPKTYSLSINTVNKHKINTKEEGDIVELDFSVMPEILKEVYLGVYDRIQSEVLNTTRFDENSDWSTMYLGRSDSAKGDKLKAEESFPISEQWYTLGKLLDGTECQLLLDAGASKSFMSKSYYIHCKSLHSLPEFASKTQRIQVGNGQYVSVLFVIPAIIDVHGHRFEIYTLVSEIHKKCRLSFKHKECFQIGRSDKFKRLLFQIFEWIITNFSNGPCNFETQGTEVNKSNSSVYRWNNKIGYDQNIRWRYSYHLVDKAKIYKQCGNYIYMVNNGRETMIFQPEEMLGIVDFRLLGYYKIKQGIVM